MNKVQWKRFFELFERKLKKKLTCGCVKRIRLLRFWWWLKLDNKVGLDSFCEFCIDDVLLEPSTPNPVRLDVVELATDVRQFGFDKLPLVSDEFVVGLSNWLFWAATAAEILDNPIVLIGLMAFIAAELK